MDFFRIAEKVTRSGIVEVYPDFIVTRSKDLMVRGRSFYAIWDSERNIWSTDEFDVQRLVDKELEAYAKALEAKHIKCSVRYLSSFGSQSWSQYRQYINNIVDTNHPLDANLTFADQETKKTDYVSKKLPYPLVAGDHSAWDELVSTLYSPEEREKIEWAIGAVISGDAKKIQKFLVFHGPGGTGKSTIMEIIQKLFVGYYASFEAKALVGNNSNFSMEPFKNNPLVAIQHDGDLSDIKDSTKLNSIVSHEWMRMNEKFKATYDIKLNAFLFMGTNKPVKITDAKAGMIRRLIDVHPTGVLIPPKRYHALMTQIDFELSGIAHHCLEVYQKRGRSYYNSYRPIEMMLQTDTFLNFIEEHFDIFKSQDGATLQQGWDLYKKYCEDSKVTYPLPKNKFQHEFRNYFEGFRDRDRIEGKQVRSYFYGFTARPFKGPSDADTKVILLSLDETESLFDLEFANLPAQYTKENGTPQKYWTDEERLIDGILKKPKPSQVVDTLLWQIDTSKLHFVKPPKNHIVIDFDLTDEDGNKSLERNLAAASEWPSTYAELSKSEKAVHLHYTYDGPVERLAREYSPGIEIKVFLGNSSLRRRLSKCNGVPIATISSGLPLKEEKLLDVKTLRSERSLRELIEKNLRKEVHPGTKPSIDFIKKILDDAYDSGMPYDLLDLKKRIIVFANNSTNQSLTCLKTVKQMKFQSAVKSESEKETYLSEAVATGNIVHPENDKLVIFDVEVFPNLFVVCWMYEDGDVVVRMINPSPQEIEALFQFKLVGFYNRRYDNHILYAAYLGENNQQLFERSQNIIAGKPGSMIAAAYNISYADVHEFSSKKQGLKKFQIDLGLKHRENHIPWDKPVPEELWPSVVDYCANDVLSTRDVFRSRAQDYAARLILSDLSGLSVNDTTQQHTARIIFGGDKNPQKSFVYTDLSNEFPGYTYSFGKSSYRGEDPKEGGYVYAEPGIYEDVAVLDVASMHPTTIGILNLFGDYTHKFTELKDARLAIKHNDFDSARQMLDGRLVPYLDEIDRIESEDLKKATSTTLQEALKIVINIVYGMTSATFPNDFRDPRNKDNIVAKRGALFMIDLKHAVWEQGFKVIHIKTDSIKIPNATPEIIEFVMEFGQKYGYTFEHEVTYDRFCLVNDAVYIAREPNGVNNHKWAAVGAQFQHPYVFKALFSHEDITFDDMCETKEVKQGAMYLDFHHGKPAGLEKPPMLFVGKTGRFVPVRERSGLGGVLYRVKDDKEYAVTGTKGYLWMEAEVAKYKLADVPDLIDMDYFEHLIDQAQATISKFGDFHEFADSF